MIVLVLLVRDEEDIVGDTIAYHLATGVDHVIATDHRSVDGTTEILRAFEGQGRMVVQTKDFMDYCDQIGRSRPWVAGELGRLGREGRLVPAGGHKYRIVPALTSA